MLQNNMKNPKSFFNPVLFWDAEDIDVERHSDYIISRILDFGDEKDIMVLRSLYSDDKLINVIKKRKGLMPMTVSFWATYFNIPQSEMTCSTK